MAEALVVIFILGIGLLIFLIVKILVAPKDIGSLSQLIKEGKTKTVIKSALAIIAKRPSHVEAHYYLGLAYIAEQRHELGFIELKTVNQLGIEGKNIPEIVFRKYIAKLYLQNGQLEDALREYLLLTELEPNQADAHYWAGRLYSSLNNTDMAIRCLNQAAILNPNDSRIRSELGAMLYKEKKNFEAKQELEKAIKIQNDTAQAYFYLGKLEKDAADYSAALTLFEQAMHGQEYRTKALLERGMCYIALQAEEKAIADLEQAVKAINDEMEQDSLFARYYLGQCYEKLEQLDKALFQWGKIHEIKKDFKDVEAKLAQYAYIRDENFKDYLSYNREAFVGLCQNLVSKVLKLEQREVSVIPDGCEIIALESAGKGKEPRRSVLLRFYRSQNPAGDREVYSTVDAIKRNAVNRAVVMSSSGFTASARSHIPSSLKVELFNKEQLQELLRKVEQNKS
jgi:tetratricopeptide (TPR) repeat protein